MSDNVNQSGNPEGERIPVPVNHQEDELDYGEDSPVIVARELLNPPLDDQQEVPAGETDPIGESQSLGMDAMMAQLLKQLKENPEMRKQVFEVLKEGSNGQGSQDPSINFNSHERVPSALAFELSDPTKHEEFPNT